MQRHQPTRTTPVMWLAAVGAVAAMAPIVVFTAAAVGRLLQPLPNQPAAAAERTYQWFVALPAAALTIAFFLLPLLAVLLAAALIWLSWRSDAALRADTHEAVGLLWRFLRRPVVWMSAGVLVVGVVLGVGIVIHGVAG
jgi:hypothetical protein